MAKEAVSRTRIPDWRELGGVETAPSSPFLSPVFSPTNPSSACGASRFVHACRRLMDDPKIFSKPQTLTPGSSVSSSSQLRDGFSLLPPALEAWGSMSTEGIICICLHACLSGLHSGAENEAISRLQSRFANHSHRRSPAARLARLRYVVISSKYDCRLVANAFCSLSPRESAATTSTFSHIPSYESSVSSLSGRFESRYSLRQEASDKRSIMHQCWMIACVHSGSA